jgi:hypothetical protein
VRDARAKLRRELLQEFYQLRQRARYMSHARTPAGAAITESYKRRQREKVVNPDPVLAAYYYQRSKVAL